MRRLDPGWQWDGPRIPEKKPLFIGVVAGADGRLWVRRVHAEAVSVPDSTGRIPSVEEVEQPEAYDLFERDGRYVGHIVLPAGGTLLFARGRDIWGTVKDTLDVPYVVRLGISRPAGRRPR